MQSRYARKHGRDVEYTRDSVECVMSSVCASAHVLMCAHSMLVWRALFPEGAGCAAWANASLCPFPGESSAGANGRYRNASQNLEQLSELVCWAVPKECIVRARTAPVSAMRDLGVKLHVQ
jgi:hypothetical protein